MVVRFKYFKPPIFLNYYREGGFLMSLDEEKRYLKIKFLAKSLDGNPLGSPVEREFEISVSTISGAP